MDEMIAAVLLGGFHVRIGIFLITQYSLVSFRELGYDDPGKYSISYFCHALGTRLLWSADRRHSVVPN